MHIIFCDGCCKPNPGPGSWAAVVKIGSQVQEIGGRVERTTNNQMEMLAAIEALEFLGDLPGAATVHTDSAYLANGFTSWTTGWIKNGWIKKTGEPVMNKDLWLRLEALKAVRSIMFKHVPGHSGVLGNERADEIAEALHRGMDFNFVCCALEDYPMDLSDLTAHSPRDPSDRAMYFKKTKKTKKAQKKDDAIARIFEL